jgi:hypothetical protein
MTINRAAAKEEAESKKRAFKQRSDWPYACHCRNEAFFGLQREIGGPYHNYCDEHKPAEYRSAGPWSPASACGPPSSVSAASTEFCAREIGLFDEKPLIGIPPRRPDAGSNHAWRGRTNEIRRN